MHLISESIFNEDDFDPMIYTEFVSMVNQQEQGDLVIIYSPDQKTSRELHLFFRWVSVHPGSDKCLLIIGVSEDDVTAEVSLWVSVGQWTSIIITFLLQVWLVVLVTSLGVEDGNNDHGDNPLHGNLNLRRWKFETK